MKTHKKTISKTLHPNNVHNHGYDFPALIGAYPALASHVSQNQHGNESINFANPESVKALNSALLAYHYNIQGWDIPKGYLCPPIPGRVDYIHYIADLLHAHDKPIKLIDIGTGANGIYALLASQVYGWQCTATDIDAQALENVTQIINQNPNIKHTIDVRLQNNKNKIFKGVVHQDELYDISVCNPPFHASLLEAQNSNREKVNNLALNRHKKRNTHKTHLNFSGQNTELWCEGGERQFLRTMMDESKHISEQCRWFTSLVSKSEHLPDMKKHLFKLEATKIKTIEMQQGNKITRILAWSFVPTTHTNHT